MTTESANEATRWRLNTLPILEPYSKVAIATAVTVPIEPRYAAVRPPLQVETVSPYNFHPFTQPDVFMSPYNSPHGIASENSVDTSMSNLTPLPQVKARVLERPTSHSQLPPGTFRPGRRGSQQCSRCRSHKRGKRGYCLPHPENPGGPCIPCIDAGLAATCGSRTYPSGRKKSAAAKRDRSMNQWSHPHDIHKDVSPRGEEVASLSSVQKQQPLKADHELTRLTSDMLDMKYDDKRPEHGLDLQSELSHPTVKRDKRMSALPLLGAQTKAVHIHSPRYQSTSTEPRHPSTPVEFDSEVALATEDILRDQCQSTNCRVDVEMSFTMETELELDQVDTMSQATGHAKDSKEELEIPDMIDDETESDPLLDVSHVDFNQESVMDNALYGTSYFLPLAPTDEQGDWTVPMGEY